MTHTIHNDVDATGLAKEVFPKLSDDQRLTFLGDEAAYMLEVLDQEAWIGLIGEDAYYQLDQCSVCEYDFLYELRILARAGVSATS